MSDGQFSSKPMRSERARGSATQAGEFTSDGRLLSDVGQAFVQSASIQREINALLEHPFPAVGTMTCAPLHKKTPDVAKELGRPLASATLVQEYLIGLLFLRICGWMFIFFGALFLLSAVLVVLGALSNPRNDGEPHPIVLGAMISAIGLGIGGAGAWFGIFRGRVITEMCWFCPRGMIWVTDGLFDWYTWEEVREVYCRPDDDRPAIGIRFDGNVSLISFSNTQASRLMVEYIENRASAACAPMMLNLIAEGNAVRFRDWRLSRSTLFSRENEITWRDVTDIDLWERELRIGRRDRDDLTISLEDIPFPSLFTALARGIHAHSRDASA